MTFPDLWSPEGTVDRGPYALVGLVGFAIKHNFDRMLATGVFHRKWGLFNYWIPLDRAARVTSLSTSDRTFLLWMLVLSLPFIWVGVALTTQRLRAMGLPLWLVALFFVPYLNLLFFLILCIYPSQSAQDLAKPPRARENRTLDKIIPDNRWGSAAMALLISSLVGAAAVFLSVRVVGVYGFGLFVALPFCLGLLSVLIYGYHHPRSLKSCLAVANLSIGLLGLALLALAIEGAICLLMAAPIGIALGSMGGCAGYWIQRRRWSNLQTQATFGAVLLFVPFLMGAEALEPQQPQLLEVRTQIEISAPPATIWHFLGSFPTLPAPTEWPFRIGIAYPIRSSLQGSGLDARRECEFSSGEFVEPIRVWEENKRLVFSISGEPPVMEEMSPYGHIHTRHIDGQYFQAQDAEFVLTPLPNGHTLLTGTSRYRNRMWPAAYWRLWSDAIVHQIHLRVFRHIKQLSEASRSVATAQ
ncbi:MAG TPA: hypothetical protein VJW93_02675 [Candidatus Acidoferrales bacterium]|nr:hypothetical protein [Candidatus Acidoferrales bacterium]